MNVTCPSCSRALAVPDEAAGKMVRCPVCQSVFAAETANAPPAPPPVTAVPEEPRAPVVPPPLPIRREDEAEGVISRERLPSQPARPRYRDDDLEDQPRRRGRARYYDDEDDDDDWRPRRSRRQQALDRAERRFYEDPEYYWQLAHAEVTGPAVALMVLGALWVLGGVGVIIFSFRALGVGGENVIGMCFAMVMLLYGGFIVLGGLMMKTLSSYGLAMAGAIVAVINHPLNVINIGIGVWALVTMDKPEVKVAFRWKAEGRHDDRF